VFDEMLYFNLLIVYANYVYGIESCTGRVAGTCICAVVWVPTELCVRVWGGRRTRNSLCG